MIMELLFGLPRQLMDQPIALQLWIFWMVLVNTASVFFLKQRAGQVVLGLWVLNLLFMSTLCYLNGYNRLLGLSHVLFWTPLVIYLIPRLRDTTATSTFGLWLRIVLITDALSLIVDYIDVARYFLGDRG